MEPYNISGIMNNVTDFTSFAQQVNSNILGGYWLGLIVQLMVFVVFFLSMKSKGNLTSTSLSVACWMTALSTLILKALGLLADYLWWLGLMLIPIAMFALFVGSKES